MTTSIQVSIVGAEEIKNLLKNGEKELKSVQLNMKEPLDKLLNIWRQEMPIWSGHMHSTVFAVMERPGRGKAFTRTFLAKPGGYARFPELGFPGATKPGFTLRTVDRFSKEWTDDVSVKIDKALLR